MIKPCSGCSDDKSSAAVFQDKRYGKGKRVHTPKTGSDKDKGACTVCGKVN
jgi:hypothetical protein